MWTRVSGFKNWLRLFLTGSAAFWEGRLGVLSNKPQESHIDVIGVSAETGGRCPESGLFLPPPSHCAQGSPRQRQAPLLLEADGKEPAATI